VGSDGDESGSMNPTGAVSREEEGAPPDGSVPGSTETFFFFPSHFFMMGCLIRKSFGEIKLNLIH
jgi:hypothetical protein